MEEVSEKNKPLKSEFDFHFEFSLQNKKRNLTGTRFFQTRKTVGYEKNLKIDKS